MNTDIQIEKIKFEYTRADGAVDIREIKQIVDKLDQICDWINSHHSSKSYPNEYKVGGDRTVHKGGVNR